MMLDTSELKSKGIDESHISSSGVAPDRLKKLYSRNSLRFVRITKTYIDGKGDLSDVNSEF